MKRKHKNDLDTDQFWINEARKAAAAQGGFGPEYRCTVQRFPCPCGKCGAELVHVTRFTYVTEKSAALGRSQAQSLPTLQ